jgi:hypothetical protein
VCEGRLVKLEEDGSTQHAGDSEDVPGDPEDGSRTEAR